MTEENIQSLAEPRRVVIAMPSHANMTGGAARGFYVSSRGINAAIPLDATLKYRQGSLLGNVFNYLWCYALNLCHRGIRIDYFAMLHADVSPEPFWLDKLISELEAHELDMLGVAVAIKDAHGLSSLALDRDDRDTWRPLCRLTMHELYQLPETITSDDVGHRLLLNTGCWVCRFDIGWANQVYFTINDRIVFNTALDCYQAQVEPEDWFFSRLCHELGLRIGATRKVAAEHVGPAEFTNTLPWGEKFDAAYLPESIIPIPERVGWRFPYDVDGWLSCDEGRVLADLARDKTVLEIGSYCGRSTICMAQTAGHVYWIDPHDGRGTPKPRDTRAEFDANIARYGVSDRVTEFSAIDEVPACDVVFIDGAHDIDSVRADIDIAIAALQGNPDGLIVFHDYRPCPGAFDGRWDPGVTEAVNEFIHSGAELISTHETVAVVKPPTYQESQNATSNISSR